MTPHEQAIASLSALRAATLGCHAELDVTSEASRELIRQRVATNLDGASEVRLLDRGRRAGILLYRTDDRFAGDVQRCSMELAHGDADAAHWVVAQLAELRPSFEPGCELLLDVAFGDILPRLEAGGLVARFKILHGDPGIALARLQIGPLDRSVLGDLRLEPLTHARHVEPVVAMMRDYFGQNRERGLVSPFMVVTPEIQARLDEWTRGCLTNALGTDTAFVVCRGDEVLGHGMFHPNEDPIFGKYGGMAFAFVPEIQGRGIGKLVYERLLEQMVARGIHLMRGRTNNPAVLRLAARMQRPLRGWQLEPPSR